MRAQLLLVQPPNTRKPVKGDSRFRRLFLTLLNTRDQREIFMDFLSHEQTVLRTGSMFGQPPYAFLLPTDAATINASAIGSSRRNISYGRLQHEAAAKVQVPSSANFGGPHFVDDQERHYRIFTTAVDVRVSGSYFVRRLIGMNEVQMTCRVRNLRSSTQVQTMPVKGDVIRMRVSRRMQRVNAMQGVAGVTVTVRGVYKRLPKSSTALLMLRVDSVSQTQG